MFSQYSTSHFKGSGQGPQHYWLDSVRQSVTESAVIPLKDVVWGTWRTQQILQVSLWEEVVWVRGNAITISCLNEYHTKYHLMKTVLWCLYYKNRTLRIEIPVTGEVILSVSILSLLADTCYTLFPLLLISSLQLWCNLWGKGNTHKQRNYMYYLSNNHNVDLTVQHSLFTHICPLLYTDGYRPTTTDPSLGHNCLSFCYQDTKNFVSEIWWKVGLQSTEQWVRFWFRSWLFYKEFLCYSQYHCSVIC